MSASHKFSHPVQVKTSDIDPLKYVNNEVYLRWLLEAAVAHSESLGLSVEKYIEMGQAFVVRRHELDYRLPAYLEDRLRVDTWTERFEGSRGVRHYEIVREAHGTNQEKVILGGLTVWVFIDMKTGRPVDDSRMDSRVICAGEKQLKNLTTIKIPKVHFFDTTRASADQI